MKKLLPLILVLVGLTTLVAAVVFWIDANTATAPQGFGNSLINWITLITGIGASIKGWMDLFSKSKTETPAILVPEGYKVKKPRKLGWSTYVFLFGGAILATNMATIIFYPTIYPIVSPLFNLVNTSNQVAVPSSSPIVVTVVITTTPVPTSTFSPTPQQTATPTLAVTETPSPIPTLTWLEETYQEKRVDSLFWVITTVAGLLFLYVIGIGALLLTAWKKGSTVFSRSWLTKLASKPLLILPGIGKWALFLGYRKRLQNQPEIVRAATRFFGVPGVDTNGNLILPDIKGDFLNEAVANSLDSQKPVLIVAKGGGGKTTLLARWSYLALNNSLPARINGYQPIFLTPAYYDGNLISSITSVLRERDGVAIDKDIVQAQMETGKYLVLIDGVSEIVGDQNKGLQEILRTARNADYRNCRFLITTRPGLIIPQNTEIIQLQPLSTEIVLKYLPIYRLDKEQEYQVKKQLSLFGDKPIDPLLLFMIVDQGKNDKLSFTRSQLYERFFRRQLQVSNDFIWDGWRTVLGEFANWFLLETGRRGVGVIHEKLMDKLSKKPGEQNTNSLFERSKKYYQLPAENELNLLDRLQASTILQKNKRWQFAHDTYEEYFVACYIMSHITQSEKLPNLSRWTNADAQIQSFTGVVEFIKELADDEAKNLMGNSNLPPMWNKILEISPNKTGFIGERDIRGLSLDIAIQARERGELSHEQYIEVQQWNSWHKWVYLKQDSGWRELKAQLQGNGIVPAIRSAIESELERVSQDKSENDLSEEVQEYRQKLLSLLAIKTDKPHKE